MPSSITTHKRTLTIHLNTCKPFLLLSSGAAMAAYSLLLVCFYPYPITVTELITVFLKLFFLSNVIALCAYIVFTTVTFLFRKAFAWCVRQAADYTRNGMNVQDTFPALSFASPAAS